MSYSWFRVEASLVDHPKAMRLAAKLEEPLALAYVLKLWSWVHRYAPTGEFSAELTPQVEAYLGWRGVPGRLLSVATEVGLLDLSVATKTDKSGQNPVVISTFCVHDWQEFQGSLVERSNKDKELKRKRRAARGARTARAENAPRAETARALQDITLQDTTPHDTTKDIAPASRAQALTDTLARIFLELRLSKYAHSGPKDGSALKRLLAVANDEEIITRWRHGLQQTGFHQVSSIAQLAQKWNDLTTTGPPNLKAPIRAETQVFKEFGDVSGSF